MFYQAPFLPGWVLVTLSIPTHKPTAPHPYTQTSPAGPSLNAPRVLPKFDPIAIARKALQELANTAAFSSANVSHNPASTSVAQKFNLGLGMGLGMSMGMSTSRYSSPGAAGSVRAAQDAASQTLVETLPSVQFLHKYTRPVDCSVTLQRLGIGPDESMVELTLRRNGPAHLLALTGPSGRVR